MYRKRRKLKPDYLSKRYFGCQSIVLVKSEKKNLYSCQSIVILVKSEEKNLYGFVYRVLWILKALWIILSETINILRNLHTLTKFRCHREFSHTLMYIAPSSGHSLITPKLSFKFILMKFEVVFCCLHGVIILHFSKYWWNFIQIHQYYTRKYGFNFFELSFPMISYAGKKMLNDRIIILTFI